jgi:hypothetical protein
MRTLFDDRTPTWAALRLDGHVSRLKVALVLYFVLVTCFWLRVFGVWSMGEALFNASAWALAVTYLFVIGEAFYIQKVMHDSAVYKHAAWQIIVGAVLLNPCALGWWMPVSVLLAAGRVRKDLDVLENKLKAQGRSPSEVDDTSVVRRPVGASWKVPISKVVLSAILLALLFLVWHFAQIQKPH